MKQITIFFCSFVIVLLSCKKPDMTVEPPPGTTAVNTIANYLKNQFELSLFAAALDKSDLVDSISTQEYTVFAVNNEGFNNAGIFKASDFDKWKKDSLNDFIKAHILPGRIFYSTIPRSLDVEYKSIKGDKLLISYFRKESSGLMDPNLFGMITINGIEVIPNPKLNPADRLPDTYGVSLRNGVAYQIGTPIKTSVQNLQEFLISRHDLNIFIAGLKKFSQWGRLASKQALTVLAPPDSVFLRYGITEDSINRMSLSRIKSLFMDAYILDFNRVFTNDIQTFTNIAQATIPFSNPRILLCPTSDPNIDLVMMPWNSNFSYHGCFLFNILTRRDLPSHHGGTFWSFPVFGTNINSNPVYTDLNTGYIIPYLGEVRYFRSPVTPKNTFVNYNCANGVLHYINGLLITPDQALKVF